MDSKLKTLILNDVLYHSLTRGIISYEPVMGVSASRALFWDILASRVCIYASQINCVAL